MTYEAVLHLYTLEDILEFNDVTPEEALEFMVKSQLLKLPEPQELEFD